MRKQKITVEIINPEALDCASKRLSKALVDIWWERQLKSLKEQNNTIK